MKIHDLYSDHVSMWSVSNGRTKLLFAQTPTRATPAQIASAGLGAAGLADRALQALRQSELQVRHWSRSWPKVLPIGESPWQASADGLCPSGRSRIGQPKHCQLCPCSRDPRRGLRDQPRTVTPARAEVGVGGEHHDRVAHYHFRRSRRRNADGQHARRLDRSGTPVHSKTGEQR